MGEGGPKVRQRGASAPPPSAAALGEHASRRRRRPPIPRHAGAEQCGGAIGSVHTGVDPGPSSPGMVVRSTAVLQGRVRPGLMVRSLPCSSSLACGRRNRASVCAYCGSLLGRFGASMAGSILSPTGSGLVVSSRSICINGCNMRTCCCAAAPHLATSCPPFPSLRVCVLQCRFSAVRCGRTGVRFDAAAGWWRARGTEVEMDVEGEFQDHDADRRDGADGDDEYLLVQEDLGQWCADFVSELVRGAGLLKRGADSRQFQIFRWFKAISDISLSASSPFWLNKLIQHGLHLVTRRSHFGSTSLFNMVSILAQEQHDLHLGSTKRGLFGFGQCFRPGA